MDGLRNEGESPDPTPPVRRFWSFGLNLGLSGLGGAWMALLSSNRDARFERWMAASVLLLVGFTGLWIRKRPRPASRREDTGAR